MSSLCWGDELLVRGNETAPTEALPCDGHTTEPDSSLPECGAGSPAKVLIQLDECFADFVDAGAGFVFAPRLKEPYRSEKQIR
jgi:hypothetical protein